MDAYMVEAAATAAALAIFLGFGKITFFFPFSLDAVNDSILDTSRPSLYLSPSLPSSPRHLLAPYYAIPFFSVAARSASTSATTMRLTPSQPSPFFATVTRLGLSSSPRNSSGKTVSKLKP